MFGKYFYNKNIRNIVILFGTLFNDINIRRYEGTGTKQQDFKIPIAYGPAQKYLTKINQGSIDDDSVHVGITLPRMSFEIITMTYDPTRKLQKTKRVETLKKLGNLNNISVRNGGNSYKAEETTVTISDAPSDYGRTATATAVITDGILVSVEVDDGGTDYINAPTVTNDSSTGTGESLEAVIENGIVTSINILSGGSGFVSPVEIFLSPPENFTSPATASNAAILNGILNTIEIVDGGTDYITPPTVTLNSSAGTGENLEVIIDNGTVTAINVLDGGVDFVSPVEVVLSAPQQGIIDSIGIVDGGLGYTTAPTVTVDNNTGTGENLEAVIDSNGTVTAINVLSGGVDFVQPVEIILSEPTGGILEGIIDTITIDDGGVDYETAPTVTVDNNTGTGENLEAVIDENGTVTAINVLDGGSGFTEPVEILLSEPPLAGTQAIANNATIRDDRTQATASNAVIRNGVTATANNATLLNGIIDSIGIVDGGVGYETAPTVTVDNNTGTGENLEAVIDANGTVTAINVLSGGVDFVEPVEIILSEPPLGGTRATTKNVFVRDGVITSINITDEGFGYNKEPDVIISSTGAGSSGTAKATLNPVSRDINRLLTTYTPVPYNFEIDLSVMVLNSDDGAQILEQILPYFTPEFHVTLNEESELEIKRDIPIILNNITTEDDYEGDFVSRRSLTHTLSFTVQGYLYGPSKSVGIIREIDINSGDNFKIDDETGRLSSPAANVKVKPKTSTEGPADEPVKITTTITDV